MTAKGALAKAFLEGKTLSIMNGFRHYAITNLPREASRLIEQPFGVVLLRKRIDFTSKYGQSGFYFTYELPKSTQNATGIQKMIEYLHHQQNLPQSVSLTPKNTIQNKLSQQSVSQPLF